jgi:protocatechuate 3,4-dioxygenase beta subunit
VAVSGKVVLPEGYSTDQLAGMSVIPERRLVPVRSQARVDANGAFSISISPSEPARFTVSNMPEGLYLKRMVLGATDLLASSSPKSVDASGQLVLELASDGATVSGSIRDSRGTAISGARVTLLPARDLASADDPARDAWKKSILTSDDGSFQITAIAPGRYRVYAFETLDADPSFDPDFLSNFGQRWK